MSSIGSQRNGMSGDVLRAAIEFGFDPRDPAVSLCPYGPVFRVDLRGKQYVIKRTGYPRSSADAVADWLRHLRRENVAAVSPCEGFGTNPRKINETDLFSWVVYDFINGRQYKGTMEDIYLSGDLLGRIHSVGLNFYGGLVEPNCIKGANIHLIRSQLKHAIAMAATKDHVSIFNDTTYAEITEIGASFVLDRTLPFVSCSWDYKASNLIIDNNDIMTLIDPDHAGRIPRVYDLACALILFHCDHPAGPRRLWTAYEWRHFLQGYTNHVTLTVEERIAWAGAMCLAWVNEGLWLLTNFPEGWAVDGEAQYLLSLLAFEPSNFTLEGTGSS